eukprot:1603884-Pyramimonas_sp.AAC.1
MYTGFLYVPTFAWESMFICVCAYSPLLRGSRAGRGAEGAGGALRGGGRKGWAGSEVGIRTEDL